MTTLARGCLVSVAALWLSAACGGSETPTTSTPNSSTSPAGVEASGSFAPSASSGTPASAMGAPGLSATAATASMAGAGAGSKATVGSMASPSGMVPSSAQAPSQAVAGTGGDAASPVSSSLAAGAGAAGAAAAGSGATAPMPDGKPNLFWLEFNSSRVMRSKDMKTGAAAVATGIAPDGVGVDVAGGKIYWTNMGSPLGTGGGTVQRANLDGSMVETIVPAGVGTTFKQMTLDLTNKKIYWGDREGAKLWRANLDGSMHEAIVSGHSLREVVGVALDLAGGKVYFTDRSGGRILRTNIEMPAGATGDNRMDVEDVLVTPAGSTPIDLEIDPTAKKLYWTDRMLGTVHVMDLEMPAGMSAKDRTDDKTIVTGLSETIGICLDVPNNKMYFTELGGTISVAALDGSGLQRGILRSSGATGCALVYMPD